MNTNQNVKEIATTILNSAARRDFYTTITTYKDYATDDDYNTDDAAEIRHEAAAANKYEILRLTNRDLAERVFVAERDLAEQLSSQLKERFGNGRRDYMEHLDQDALDELFRFYAAAIGPAVEEAAARLAAAESNR